MDSTASFRLFLHAVGIKVVVVHGGGKAITESLKEKIKSEFKEWFKSYNKKNNQHSR